ncbi:hypothetical protein PPS11_20119 [Pseudomonas putida S11]|nr:hypothetical protein PPS11_20119 [Pseudomonas putida S11]
MAVVAAEHLLEKDDVGLGAAHRLAQFRQDEAPVEGGEALVGYSPVSTRSRFTAGAWLTLAKPLLPASGFTVTPRSTGLRGSL